MLGNAVVPRLNAAGHAVHALSHSDANDVRLHNLGAQATQADLFDATSLQRVLDGCEAILHLATRIAPTAKMAIRASWYENDHIRREGTRNLVEAALAVGGIHTFIYPSYAFVYPDSGDKWIDAETTVPQPTQTQESTLDAEVAVANFGEERRGISLRMASLYGLESPATREQLAYARKGIAALPGLGDAYLPQVTVHDGANAIVTALVCPIPSGVYDVADDDPLTRDEDFAAMAEAVGRRRLRQLPTPVMRMLTGVVFDTMSRSLRVSNRRFKEASGWRPLTPNARVGWERIGESTKVDAAPS